MRIIGHMVTRNEADRYLPQSLEWLRSVTDDVYVYDDQSVDRTVDVAHWAGAHVQVRHPEDPAFAEDESAFRQAAWDWMSEEGELTEQDWVLCIDADEFLVRTVDGWTPIEAMLTDLAKLGQPITFPVAEIFAIESGTPMTRLDGFWSDITARRFVPWTPDSKFATRIEGGGSVPKAQQGEGLTSDLLTILHLGYASASDRHAKFQRYMKGTGHNRMHVESIMRVPNLTPWLGQIPEVDL